VYENHTHVYMLTLHVLQACNYIKYIPDFFGLFQLESIPIREAPPKEIEKVGFSHLSDLSTSCSATCLFHPIFIFFLSLLNHFGGKSPSLEISTIIVSEEVQQLCTMSLALRGRGTI